MSRETDPDAVDDHNFLLPCCDLRAPQHVAVSCGQMGPVSREGTHLGVYRSLNKTQEIVNGALSLGWKS